MTKTELRKEIWKGMCKSLISEKLADGDNNENASWMHFGHRIALRHVDKALSTGFATIANLGQ